MTSSVELMNPHRPVAFRALNRAAGFLQQCGLLNVPLELDSLLNAARRRTGLEDFGEGDFREPLRRLIVALNDEARLNFVGRMAARQDVIQILSNRLHLAHDRRKYPEITAQEIVRPLFIIGMPRTGTTLLHGLLAQDPANRVPVTWEAMHPSPPTAEGEEARIRRAKSDMAWLGRLVPDFKAIHPVDAMLPQECITILSHSFLSDQFDVMFNVPGYRAWQERQDMRPAYECHRRFLQQLNFRRSARRWVLKAPAHMLAMESLLAVYPDAQIVQTHREPLEVMASTASLTTMLRSAFSDFVDPALIGREMSEFWSETLNRFMAVRDGLPPGRFFDVDFAELLEDPIAAVRRLYAWSGDELSSVAEKRMRDFLLLNTREKHGRHHYTLAQFGLDTAAESPRFDRYRERFHLEPA